MGSGLAGRPVREQQTRSGHRIKTADPVSVLFGDHISMILYAETGSALYNTQTGSALLWTMGEPVEVTTILNRCRQDQTYGYRLEHGLLP